MNNIAKDFKNYQNSNQPELTKRRLKKINGGQENFRQYCNLINPSFFKPEREYQDIVCQTLQDFYENKLMNLNTGEPYDILILNLPPGFGKSYTASLFATWIYGKNSQNQVIVVSYDKSLSVQFSKTVRDLINDTEIEGEPDYYAVNSFFPEVKIKYGDAAMQRWSLEEYYNSYLATSFEGAITGMRGTIGIIDDPIRDAKEALNEHVKNEHWNYYKNTFSSRILDGGKQIINQTRWATDDLSGRLITEFPERCFTLSMKALDEASNSICEDLYSTKNLLMKRATLDESFWLANYEQTPIDKQGALYSGFKTYDVIDYDMFVKIINYTDTADEGIDYLSGISAGVTESGYIYVLDIYHTDEPMEVTEPELARRLTLHKIKDCIIESNNGGKGFARNVIEKLKHYKNRRCNITWFHQTKNKKTRILVNAASIQEKIIMPENWDKDYPVFYKHLMSYQRKGKNKFDDGPDALTGLYEFAIGEVKGKQKAKVLKRSLFGI